MKLKKELWVLPRAKRLQMKPGCLPIGRNTLITADARSTNAARFLTDLLDQALGIKCPRGRSGAVQGIHLRQVERLSKVDNQEEGYAIRITPAMAALTAASERGLFHACQSLLDLIAAEKRSRVIPCCEICDWPDFSYRGFMADPARCFMPMERLKWSVDLLARNKLNFFHVHFANDHVERQHRYFPTAQCPA